AAPPRSTLLPYTPLFRPKQPHARPALTASPTSRAASPARRAGGAPAAPPAVRDGSRYANAISTSPRAAASAVATIAIRHDERVRSEEHTSELQSRFELVC